MDYYSSNISESKAHVFLPSPKKHPIQVLVLELVCYNYQSYAKVLLFISYLSKAGKFVQIVRTYMPIVFTVDRSGQ